MASALMMTLYLVALATLTSAYYVNQPTYGDQNQQVQSVQHDVSSDQHYQHAAYVNQPDAEGGAGQHAIYINVNSMAPASHHSNPCDDPVLKNHLVNCPGGAAAYGGGIYG